MNKNISRLLQSTALLGLATLFIQGCSPTGILPAESAGEKKVLRAIDPDADIAFYANLKAMNDASIVRKLDGMQDQVQQTAEAREMIEKLQGITGIDNENFIHMAFSMKNAEAMQYTPENVLFTLGIYLDKPVTADQIADAIYTVVSEEDPEAERLNVVKGNPADFIELIPVDNAPTMKIGVITESGSTTVFFGDEDSVNKSVGRSGTSIPSRLMDPSAGLLTREQAWVSIIVPDSFREELSMAAQQGAMMLGSGLMAMETLNSLGVAVRASDQLDLAIGFNLGDEQAASQIKTVLENSVISGARMFLGGQTPEPLPLLQSLNASQQGDRAVFSFSITLKDIELAQEMLAPSF